MTTTAKVIARPLDDTVAQWHLACCLTRMQSALEALDRASIPIYCPKIEIMKPPPLRTLKPSQRKFAYMLAVPVHVPLFPGYFLVGLYRGQDHHEIFKAWKIDGLRCEGGLPVPIDERFLKRMRECENASVIPAATKLKLLLEEGDIVKLQDGPFAGHTGTVDELGDMTVGSLDDDTRLWIALHVFGGPTRVATRLGSVVKVEQ